MSRSPDGVGRGAPRTRLEGERAIEAALEAGVPLALLILPRPPLDASLTALRQRAERVGIQIWSAGDGDLRRMSADSDSPARVLAVAGAPPTDDLEAALSRGGASWLMHRAAYPSNVGFAIRTVEVAGADALVIDAPSFNHRDRSRASHVSMGADRMLPVVYADTPTTLTLARRLGHRTVAIENVGSRTLFDVDLTGQVLLLVGNERSGIDRDVLSQCDDVVRIPMAGFVPSYSLQAAVAAVASERLRQLRMR